MRPLSRMFIYIHKMCLHSWPIVCRGGSYCNNQIINNNNDFNHNNYYYTYNHWRAVWSDIGRVWFCQWHNEGNWQAVDVPGWEWVLRWRSKQLDIPLWHGGLLPPPNWWHILQGVHVQCKWEAAYEWVWLSLHTKLVLDLMSLSCLLHCFLVA